MRRFGWVAVTILAALALGRAAYGGYMSAQQCAHIHARADEFGVVEKGRGPSDITAVGDSYAAGVGLPDSSVAWAPLVAGRVDGVGGTGYINGGPCGNQSFEERLDRALSESPRVVILEGGLNDTDSPPSDVEASARRVLQRLAAVPVVVVLGPPDAPTRTGEDRIDAALRHATVSSGRLYVPLLNEPISLGGDRLHPTAKGQKHIAALVTAALEAAAGAERDEVSR